MISYLTGDTFGDGDYISNLWMPSQRIFMVVNQTGEGEYFAVGGPKGGSFVNAGYQLIDGSFSDVFRKG